VGMGCLKVATAPTPVFHPAFRQASKAVIGHNSAIHD